MARRTSFRLHNHLGSRPLRRQPPCDVDVWSSRGRAWLVMLLLLLVMALPRPSRAVETVAWLTGPAFQRQLELPIGLEWSETPLRQGLRNLAAAQRVAIWLDRRIDPGRPIDFSAADLPLEQAVREIAQLVHVEVAVVGNVVYVGPPGVPDRLATTAALHRQAIAGLAANARHSWEKSEPRQWPELTMPRELAGEVAQQANLRLVEPQRIPHDLWAAGELPAVPTSDQLAILLAGFDLTFEISPDGSALRAVPLPARPILERTFTVTGNPERLLDQLAPEFPDVQLQRVGNRIVGKGSQTDLELIARLLRGESVSRTPAASQRRYTLDVANAQAGAIVALLKKRANLEVRIDPAVEPRLRETVSLEVKEVTLEELLTRTLDPVGIRFRLEGRQLELLPKQ